MRLAAPPVAACYDCAMARFSPEAEAWDVLDHIDDFARLAAIGRPAEAAEARRRIIAAAPHLGGWPASIQGLYEARGKGLVGGFTLPAVNIRGLTYETARALFRAMIATDGLAIFELNRAEVGFTAQEPAEFSALVLAAAIAERYSGPVFIQADHMMANATAFAADPEAETAALEELIRKAVSAGFFNIDIDSSTLVDLSFERVNDQQRPNARLTAHLARLVRGIEPAGLTISIGGEIGEVGAHNSTAEELVEYLQQFRALAGEMRGLSKVSVQTGTTHGGVPLADGTIAEVAIDFETLGELSRLSRERYGMAGAVQHGASTLPEELFGRFPDVETAEVHLATGFQNLVMDHAAFPAELRDRIHEHCSGAYASERVPGEMTDRQFFYKVRKKAWGPFKAEILALPPETRSELGKALGARFEFLIRRLRAAGTRGLADRFVADWRPSTASRGA